MKLKTPAEVVSAFRARHQLTGEDMDELMGFASAGRATRRWESEGAPYYITLLISYADEFGIELMQRLRATVDHGERTPGDAVKVFRERHRLDQPSMDRLMGFSSAGRATRRWEAEDAPSYAAILFAYANAYGLDLMERLAVDRERKKLPHAA